MLKSLPKIITIFFLTIFIFQLACLLFLLVLPNASQAAEIKFTPQVQVLDYAFNAKDASTGNIARYVRAIYKYAIGIVGILAAMVLMIGGVMWIVAGGNATAIGEAKAWIGASLTGLVIALCSYLILATVNPALVDLKTTPVTPVTPTESKITTGGCCVPNNNSNACTTGTRNDAGISLCLGGGEETHVDKPCNTIPQCAQYLTSCDGTNNGVSCTPLSPGPGVCANGRCELCVSVRGNRCDVWGAAIFCCPGLTCTAGFMGPFNSKCQ